MLSNLRPACRLLQAESELNEASSGSPRSSLSSQGPDAAMRRATNESARPKQSLRAPVKIAAHSPSRVQTSSKPSTTLKSPGMAAGLTHRRSGTKSSLPGSSASSTGAGSTMSAGSSPSRSRPAGPSKLGANPAMDTLKSQVIAICCSEKMFCFPEDILVHACLSKLSALHD